MTSDEILNYLIFMSRNVLHVRCYVRVNSTPWSPSADAGGVTLMLILEEENNLLPATIDFLSPLHIDTQQQSNNVRGTLLR